MLLRLISLITGRRIIYLEDHQGDVYKTIESGIHPFSGKVYTYVYWLFKIRLVQLNEDGTVDGGSYIERWKYA